ncbi:helix-turn-helix domain-containing protein [Deferribacter abyssi]|uniref:helix-turn-helix domain-containing protein n=1 Tax=Deferribacter abyssi TaxID=213806 RepID=UPI003C133192
MFNEKLKNAIKFRNLTQKKIADILEISPSRLANYISGLREPDIETIKKLAKALNVPVSYFFDEIQLEDAEYIKKYTELKPPFKKKINEFILSFHKLSYQETPENIFGSYKKVSTEADLAGKYPRHSTKRAFYYLYRLKDIYFKDKKVAESAKSIERILTNTDILDRYITRQITDEELWTLLYEQLTHYF